MGNISSIIQIIIPLGILNVWLLRAGRATAYRGGAASSLKSEFAAYGLPIWAFYGIGALKLLSAGLIFAGLFVPGFVLLGAGIMVGLMLGAIAMHAKVKDPAIRYLPATAMLAMSVFLLGT